MPSKKLEGWLYFDKAKQKPIDGFPAVRKLLLFQRLKASLQGCALSLKIPPFFWLHSLGARKA
jgi:hypothetical protein